jgi:recombination protein RecA
MKEEERGSAIRLKLSRMEIRRLGSPLPTGFGALDAALGSGGLPRGHVVEIFGPPDSGKTTLGLQIVARAQREGLTAGWVDADRKFDPEYAAVLGVAIERLPLVQPDSAEHAMAMLQRLTSSGALDLLVVDSAAALVPSLELEAGVGDHSPGLHGRVLASGLRMLVRAAANADASIVFLNQARFRWLRSGEESEQMETSAGGSALKLYASVRVALSSAETSRTRFRVLKNKVATPYSIGELARKAGHGFVESP